MQLLYSGIAKSKEYVLKYFISKNVVEFFSIGGDAATATLKFLLSEKFLKVSVAASVFNGCRKEKLQKGIFTRIFSSDCSASTRIMLRYAIKQIKYPFCERKLITNNFY